MYSKLVRTNCCPWIYDDDGFLEWPISKQVLCLPCYGTTNANTFYEKIFVNWKNTTSALQDILVMCEQLQFDWQNTASPDFAIKAQQISNMFQGKTVVHSASGLPFVIGKML